MQLHIVLHLLFTCACKVSLKICHCACATARAAERTSLTQFGWCLMRNVQAGKLCPVCARPPCLCVLPAATFARVRLSEVELQTRSEAAAGERAEEGVEK